MRTLGTVLAGGKSQRFGAPKALAPFLGEPMALRAVRTLQEVTAFTLAVTQNPTLRDLVPCPCSPDLVPGAGPLAGVHTALVAAANSGCDGVLVLACDMPLVSTPILRLLLAEAGGPKLAVVPESPDGPEPLCAWYSVACRTLVERRLASGALGLRAFLADLEGRHSLPVEIVAQICDPSTSFRSANTPEELWALEALVREGKAPSSIESRGRRSEPGMNPAPLCPYLSTPGHEASADEPC